MIFGQSKKMDSLSVRTWYALAAGALFVILLAALVHVVNGQVEQAQFRQMQSQTMQAAVSGCAAHQLVAARRQCMAQLDAGLAPDFNQPAKHELLSLAELERLSMVSGQRPPRALSGMAGSATLDKRSLTKTDFVR